MSGQHLESCKERFESIVSRCAALADKYAGTDPAVVEAVKRFRGVYEDRIDDLNPVIMIYGIYNAGKSTLLNALIGERRAEMNDVPTTVKVTAYQWNEYTIYDTPGINAPDVRDEIVSKEQLDRSDVVMFVMDTEGAFSSAKNYRELSAVISSRKRLLIVLNNKSGLDLSNPEDASRIESIKGRVYADFAECYGLLSKDDLASRFKIVVVDANTALLARTERTLDEADRCALLASSNIEALEDAIVAEYSQASGMTVLAELAQLLQNELDALAQALQSVRGDGLSQKGIGTIDALNRQQNSLASVVTDIIHDRSAALKDDIFRILTSSENSDAAKESIEKLVEELLRDVQEEFEAEARKCAMKVDAEMDGFESAVSDLNVNATFPGGTEVEVPSSVPGELAPAASTPRERLLETAATVAIAKPMVNAGVKALTPLVASLPVVGPILAPILPVALPIMVLVGVCKALFGGGDDREALERQRAEAAERMEAEMARQREIARRKQECVDESARIAVKIEMSVAREYRARITAMFEPQYAAVRKAMEAAQSESAKVLEDLRTIQTAKAELSEMFGLKLAR